MNTKEIKEIINLMNEHQLCEVEIERNGLKIKLKKTIGSVQVQQEAMSLPAISTSTSVTPKSDTGKAEVADENTVIIRSPMVGTFYAAPSPDREAYAAVGKDVKEGEVLCIVEAMKLMNEIKSEVNGRVVEVLAKNGQPVEFDQPLFKIRKS
ncbi:MAG: acetyl-CoA carboxylase, biotin carboxyl carrier protein [Candidatus Omnitrophica bacterium CG11_big_fil_rev_8_21_14_0_20_45_26]|uniref:Biotin carboxyl carrier protein of acetyl-CoA carboxylase n=1 Tax=Candidatus Abzuiibacterium crystallinum TaxID=1974748 RepID=A0A2H0LS14_9BACT|nr:MAG: acetyl-CoA carboxylase, biotin carboxyl carrier protein [Candidatus Omnitrophica bacterium CG11_big_fil_rev_8_21_14_0_20_45_26]PIW64972.1 MAG: acetyl-CoA carboxylase, biotin carboxyl carrier protein [Candidatus Omnitrophica bacterium CG12_big_fil_rev_8_21_14_0_65_45_16]